MCPCAPTEADSDSESTPKSTRKPPPPHLDRHHLGIPGKGGGAGGVQKEEKEESQSDESEEEEEEREEEGTEEERRLEAERASKAAEVWVGGWVGVMCARCCVGGWRVGGAERERERENTHCPRIQPQIHSGGVSDASVRVCQMHIESFWCVCVCVCARARHTGMVYVESFWCVRASDRASERM
jgi:hypothetical protein